MTNATVALEQGVSIEAIASQLGHKSTRMTRGYAHVTEDMRRASLATVSEAVRKARSG